MNKIIEKRARKESGSTRRTLKNGLLVANFNSPHAFYFDDGSILNAVDSEFSKETMLMSRDICTDTGKFVSVNKVFEITNICAEALIKICQSSVDIVIVPLPVLLLMKNDIALRGQEVFDELPHKVISTIKSKLATCFVVDRISKVVSADKFCQ